MVLRSLARKHVFSAPVGCFSSFCLHRRPGKPCRRLASSAAGSATAADGPPKNPSSERRARRLTSTPSAKPLDLGVYYKSIYHNEKQKRSQERDFLVSVLSSSPTKRDAKKYLQTFGGDHVSKALQVLEPPPAGNLPVAVSKSKGSQSAADGIRAVRQSPQFVQEPATKTAVSTGDQPHVAIVKLQDPDTLDDTTLAALAKTFVQLRALGLCSVIVIGRTVEGPNTTPNGWLDRVTHETLRVAAAIDKYGDPVTSVVDASVTLDNSRTKPDPGTASPFVPGQVYVDRPETLMRPLRSGDIVVIPPYAFSTQQCAARPVPTEDIVLALTRFFGGLPQTAKDAADADEPPTAAAIIDRIIVIDPLGGPPSERRPNGSHVFLNLEEEYAQVQAELDKMAQAQALALTAGTAMTRKAAVARHKANLDLVQHALALLPSSASALLTTPAEAGNLMASVRGGTAGAGAGDDVFGFVGSVGTRRSQNPLIHNLLTDRPVFSSSLPLGRVTQTRPAGRGQDADSMSRPPRMAQTTLVKRGMPLTMYPDPRQRPWTPPVPGGPRLRLTDTCIDLPRLVHLINDSFNRRLDVEDYLRRVDSSLAGVIIAGEYEGGAILTWERPAGLDEATAYRTGRLVPYLDKFAVLKKSQGAGGVADIVFTAMVRTCLPYGVCWRSRKDNPVNRWYFERSRGSWKLDGAQWTLFWTTPWEVLGEQALWDYADVCRGIAPSWADGGMR